MEKVLKLIEYKNLNKTFIIAEIGQAHDGSVGILHSLVKAAATTGVDAIKFQVHIAKAESSMNEPFRIEFSHVDSTRFDYWKRMELPSSEWKIIKNPSLVWESAQRRPRTAPGSPKYSKSYQK